MAVHGDLAGMAANREGMRMTEVDELRNEVLRLHRRLGELLPANSSPEEDVTIPGDRIEEASGLIDEYQDAFKKYVDIVREGLGPAS